MEPPKKKKHDLVTQYRLVCLGAHFLCVHPPAGVQEKMGIMNRGVVYALWDFPGENPDELPFREGDCMTIVRREDEDEIEWWWARLGDNEGYIPRNLLGVRQIFSP